MMLWIPTVAAVVLASKSFVLAAPAPASSSSVSITGSALHPSPPVAVHYVPDDDESQLVHKVGDDEEEMGNPDLDDEEDLSIDPPDDLGPEFYVDEHGPISNSTLVTRAAPKPKYVVYASNWLGESTFPSEKDLGGYTHFNLAFWMSTKPVDNALSWSSMTPAVRSKLKKRLAASGTKLMVSAFGATEQPTTQGRNSVQRARALANFVKKYGFDGVDVDYEDLTAFNSGSGKGEQWLINFTRELRKQLGPKKIISHAPVAPWFQPGGRWRGGGYLKVHKAVGKYINFYNVQFYNQGAGVYGNCETLMQKSNAKVPKTSVMEMIASGVPGGKIVVGKPAGKDDAVNGQFAAKDLGKCLKKYRGKHGFEGSAMVWQWAHAGKKWVQAVRGA